MEFTLQFFKSLNLNFKLQFEKEDLFKGWKKRIKDNSKASGNFEKVCEEKIKIMVKEVEILKGYLKKSYKSFAFSCK